MNYNNQSVRFVWLLNTSEKLLRNHMILTRACLKKAFRELRVPVCGRFYPNEGGVAGYGNRMRVKYTAKWGLQIAEMIFQTRSSHQLRLCSRGSADPRESLRRCRISSLLKAPAKGCLPGAVRPPASGFRWILLKTDCPQRGKTVFFIWINFHHLG